MEYVTPKELYDDLLEYEAQDVSVEEHPSRGKVYITHLNTLLLTTTKLRGTVSVVCPSENGDTEISATWYDAGIRFCVVTRDSGYFNIYWLLLNSSDQEDVPKLIIPNVYEYLKTLITGPSIGVWRTWRGENSNHKIFETLNLSDLEDILDGIEPPAKKAD